jgi:hypothetical protein
MRFAASLLVVLLSAVTMVTVGTPAAFGLPPITYYVATNGSDSWSGTLPVPNSGHTDAPARGSQPSRCARGPIICR